MLLATWAPLPVALAVVPLVAVLAASVLVARSDAREARARANRARTEADAANAAKAIFLATMSHELRTPLNAISGYVDLLLAGIRGPLTEQQRGDLSRIRRAETHLLGLINDMLNLAKLESGDVQFAQDLIALPEMLAHAASMIEPQALAKGVSFSHKQAEDGQTVYGDRDKVLQIVMNLLTNGIKFTPPGGCVALSARPVPGNGAMEIIVKDTGRGMPAGQLSSIFEPFVQVGRRPSGSDGGAGLGLAISRDLARGMGGDITATSTEGAGSIFVVKLPTVRPSSAPTLSGKRPA